jgi:hypothetical protein
MVPRRGRLSWEATGCSSGAHSGADSGPSRKVDLAILEGYQGSCELRPGWNLELRVRDGRVMMEECILIPTSERTLFSLQDYAEIEVVVGDDGAAARLDWKIGEQTYPLPRVDFPDRGVTDAQAEAIDSFVSPAERSSGAPSRPQIAVSAPAAGDGV